MLIIVSLLPGEALPQKKPAKQAEVKIQKTSLTRDQELQLGRLHVVVPSRANGRRAGRKFSADAILAELQFYPKKTYFAATGNFAREANRGGHPSGKAQAGRAAGSGSEPHAAQRNSAGLKDYPAKGFSIPYPTAGQVGQPQQGGSLYLVPQDGAKQGQNNSVELLTGAMIDCYLPASGAAKLDETIAEFVQSLAKGDASLKADKSIATTLGNKSALLTRMTTKTSAQQDQTAIHYTVARDAGLW